ncbi:MAG: FkbM family methyltransferase [Synergistetes bacterium]|nr:FkbM family methyltransferase [Synergistota bacterium]
MRISTEILRRIRLLKKAIISKDYVNWESVLEEILNPPEQGSFPSLVILEKRGDFGLYQIGDKKFYFPIEFDPTGVSLCYVEIFLQRFYEYKRCQVFPGDWVIDAGACEGLFSLYVLEKGANVIAFEPVPELAKALELTLEDYIKAGRAMVFPYGLGKRREKVDIFVFRNWVVGSTLSGERISYLSPDLSHCNRSSVNVISLDELLEEGLLPPVSFIKADVEGYERELLLGACEFIRKYKPRLSICTYHLPDDYIEIPKIVEGFGLKYRIRLVACDGTLKIMYAW